VIDWCSANGERPTGVHWEIYGPHRDDPAELTTEVFRALATLAPSGHRDN